MSVLPLEGRTFPVTVATLIVGGGACGLTAALAAHDAGAAPLVLERGPACLGSSSMSLGAVCAAGTEGQKICGVEDGADVFFADIMEKTRGGADPLLARAVADASGPTIDWLSSRHDVSFAFDPGWSPGFGHSRARMHATPERTGMDMMSRLLAAADRAGVDILTDAHVTDLFVGPDGRVGGVRARRPDGSAEEIGCDALVLATCGFGANHDLISHYIPSMRQARYFGWEGNQGDGILWAGGLNAALADMDAYQGLGLLADPQGIDVNPKFLLEGAVQVNVRGERFSNELEDVSGQGAVVIAQPEARAFVVFDERIHQLCADLPQYRALLELNARKSGGSAEELALAIGAPERALAATLAEVSRLAREGATDRFGRRFSGPPLSAPYHALRVTGALFHTLGGLVVDADARVQRATGGGMPNLFAGGGAARSFSGRGPSGYLPGAGLCAALTLGRIAGSSAAKLTPSAANGA